MTTIDRITSYVAALGVLLTGVSFAWSVPVGTGALAGATIAVADWLVTAFLGRRLLAAAEKARTVISLALVAKMGLVLAACAAVLVLTRVHPGGFLVGVSALFGGIVAGSLHGSLSTAPVAATSESE
jgi:hypothetical protein